MPYEFNHDHDPGLYNNVRHEHFASYENLPRYPISNGLLGNVKDEEKMPTIHIPNSLRGPSIGVKSPRTSEQIKYFKDRRMLR